MNLDKKEETTGTHYLSSKEPVTHGYMSNNNSTNQLNQRLGTENKLPSSTVRSKNVSPMLRQGKQDTNASKTKLSDKGSMLESMQKRHFAKNKISVRHKTPDLNSDLPFVSNTPTKRRNEQRIGTKDTAQSPAHTNQKEVTSDTVEVIIIRPQASAETLCKFHSLEN